MSIVSVIIPVHNTAPYLRKCVDSVRSQTLDDIEIVLVENLSDDGSAEICDEYSRMDSRIKTLHLPVAGLSIARNAGIKVASSPYIGFLDSDDYIEPTMYQEMYDAVVVNQAQIAYCNFCYEDQNGITEPYIDSSTIHVLTKEEVIQGIVLDGISSSSCTKLFRRELFDSILFPEGFFFEDHAVVYQWVGMCDKVVWIDKTFYHYVQREESICHTITPLKRYHFFIAEYSRLSFIDKTVSFDSESFAVMVNVIAKNCLWAFKEFLLLSGRSYDKRTVDDMRKKLKVFLSYREDGIGNKNYRRIKQISYFWAVYYMTHFYFKKKKR